MNGEGEDRRNITPFENQILEKIHNVNDIVIALKVQLDNQDRRELERIINQEKTCNGRMGPIEQLLKKHDSILFGDGSESQTGIVKDLDRVKQRNILMNWIVSIASGALFVDISKKIWEHFWK